MTGKDYKMMHNEELIELFFTEEDNLPRAAAEEVIRRGAEILPMLEEIIMDKIAWTADPPEWWAPVHATYLAGAIGGKECLTALLAALRWSDAYENEWVTEDLPSILGSLSDASWDEIIKTANDRSACWSARSIAMDALGSQALRFPNREEEAMAILGRILSNEKEDYGARRSAAFVLLDFRRADFKSALLHFAGEEARLQEQQPDYRVAFTSKEVETDLGSPRVALDIYIRDWLVFYNPEEIRSRQDRWSGEDRRTKPDSQKKLH